MSFRDVPWLLYDLHTHRAGGARDDLRGGIDVAKAIEESKAGKVEYRTDRNAIVHLVIGKREFEDRKLLENYAAVIDELIRAKPSAAKGRYLRTITLSSTMGPGIKVDPTRTRDIVEEPVAA